MVTTRNPRCPPPAPRARTDSAPSIRTHGEAMRILMAEQAEHAIADLAEGCTHDCLCPGGRGREGNLCGRPVQEYVRWATKPLKRP